MPWSRTLSGAPSGHVEQKHSPPEDRLKWKVQTGSDLHPSEWFSSSKFTWIISMPNPQRKESTYLVCVFLSLAGLGQISFPLGKWPQALKARVNPLPPDTIMAFLIVFLEAWASSSPKTVRKHPALSTVSGKWACRLCSNQWVAWLPRFYIVRSTSWGWFHYCSSLIRTFLKGSHVPSHFLGAQIISGIHLFPTALSPEISWYSQPLSCAVWFPTLELRLWAWS